MFTWILVYLCKNVYFNARLHDSSLHILRLQNTLSVSSFTAATSVVVNVVSERETRRLLEEFSRQRDGMMQLKSNAERDAPIVDDEGNAVTVEVMSIASTYEDHIPP